MKRVLMWLPLVAYCSLEGCATDPLVIHDFCSIAQPIYLAPGEAKLLSVETRREIDKNNQRGADQCGWGK
jgi:hypothetical protein